MSIRIYKSIDVDVEVDVNIDEILDEIDTDDLIEELRARNQNLLEVYRGYTLSEILGEVLNINIHAFTDEELLLAIKENFNKKF